MAGRTGARKPRSSSPKESVIQAHVMRWLHAQPDVLAWSVKSVGTYDPKLRKFRTPPKWFRPGVPDVHFFLNGRFFMVELKTESGRLSPSQHAFREAFIKAAPENACHSICRSLDEVIDLVMRSRRPRAP